MSRAFVKEGDQEDIPVVAPRAFLPEGIINYVTPTGWEQLKQERQLLQAEQDALKSLSVEDNRIKINYLAAKLQLLDERISISQVVELKDQSNDRVRFGATVKLYKEEEDCYCEYQIVGVDEADIHQHKVSFLSPIAKALLNRTVGDNIILKTPNGERHMEIETISYK